MITLQRAAAVLLACGLAACAHTPAPAYQPSVENTSSLLSGQSDLQVGTFDAATGVENEHLAARGGSMSGGSDGLYSTYLREALLTELEAAGRLDHSSATVIEGTLMRNELNAGGIRTADSVVAARFVVTRENERIFDRTLTAEHEWESSFIGAIAVPAAFQNYVATVQQLLGMLFADPEFREATLVDTGASAL